GLEQLPVAVQSGRIDDRRPRRLSPARPAAHGCPTDGVLPDHHRHRRQHHVLTKRSEPSGSSVTATLAKCSPRHGPPTHNPSSSSKVAPCTAQTSCPLWIRNLP